MSYKVVVNESEEGFSISCPGLPGCWSQGETEAEALVNFRDAIREYFAAIDDLVKGFRRWPAAGRFALLHEFDFAEV